MSEEEIDHNILDFCVRCGFPIEKGDKYHKNEDDVSTSLMCIECYNDLRQD